ncbi:MAG: PQQ-dependent sugar dehydrogenase, partial [Ardenticatenaceae bacterium]
YYSAPLRTNGPANWNHTSHISEFRVSGSDPNRADPASERILLRVDQPQSNHNGGTVAFGSDGYLYISLGDGGAANDTGLGHPPRGNGQDRTTILGSLLRIDVVDNGNPYAIPADNPFVGQEGADEIYAYGFRNPYRFSWDRQSGALYVADAGQNLYEEVSRVSRGGNYGWNIREGTHCFSPSSPDNPPASCPDTGPWGESLIPPVIEYAHPNQSGGIGLVVVGGHVYRGDAIPGLVGNYVFGDWSRSFDEPLGQLLAATPLPEGAGTWPVRPLSTAGIASLGHFVLGFGEDGDGELYVLVSQATGPGGNTGKVYKLVAAP